MRQNQPVECRRLRQRLSSQPRRMRRRPRPRRSCLCRRPMPRRQPVLACSYSLSQILLNVLPRGGRGNASPYRRRLSEANRITPQCYPTARHRRSPIVFPRAPRVTGGEQTNFTLRRLVLMSPSLGRHPEREEVKPTRRPLLDLEPASAMLRPYFPGLITVIIRLGTSVKTIAVDRSRGTPARAWISPSSP